MKDYKVLMDLSTIMCGRHAYAGIPQEARMIFKIFSETDNIKPTGLICGLGRDVLFQNLSNRDNNIHQTLKYAEYFISLEDKIHPPIKSVLRKIYNKTMNLIRIGSKVKSKKDYHLYDLDNSFYHLIWRKAFDNFVDHQHKDLILNQDFVISNFSKFLLNAKIHLNLPTFKLHTDNYDFVVFQQGLPQTPLVSKETIPIVRYHDAIPLFYPDTVADPRCPSLHANSILFSKKNNAVFVCNSKPVREELIKLEPSLENRTFVIPVPLLVGDADVVPEGKFEVLPSIIGARTVKNSFSHRFTPDNLNNYILGVSTLEPRKNYLSLIRAWERACYLFDKDLKLIIVGSQGWKSEPILEAMEPHIAKGNIIHLEKVPVYELRILYACARAMVFPTYYEGFGNTPVEAMHAGCPVIVSDIPTTRWVLGDAALYCDPYDINSITDSIGKLLYSSESQQLKNDLIQKGRTLIQKYSSAAVGQEWLGLFDKLQSMKNQLKS